MNLKIEIRLKEVAPKNPEIRLFRNFGGGFAGVRNELMGAVSFPINIIRGFAKKLGYERSQNCGPQKLKFLN